MLEIIGAEYLYTVYKDQATGYPLLVTWISIFNNYLAGIHIIRDVQRVNY